MLKINGYGLFRTLQTLRNTTPVVIVRVNIPGLISVVQVYQENQLSLRNPVLSLLYSPGVQMRVENPPAFLALPR